MSDFIDRQAAIERVLVGKLSDDSLVECVEECNSMIEWTVDVLKNIPSAQPEIIMCKDCKHYSNHDKRCTVWNHGVVSNGYCYKGGNERR